MYTTQRRWRTFRAESLLLGRRDATIICPLQLTTTRYFLLNICPCCGSPLTNDLRITACGACGALAVGPPLARPEHELPSYGRALAVSASGAGLFAVFAAGTLSALWAHETFSLAFWNVVAAGETAAWRLKWAALPLSFLAAWAAWRVSASVQRAPARFVGLRAARVGFALSATVALVLTTLIGVTVPERLRQRERASDSAQQAIGYEASRVLLEYQARYGSFPATAKDLTDKLPDADGAVARVAALLSAAAYAPESAIASLPPAGAKSRAARRGAVVQMRNASLRTNIDGAPGEAFTFTNYKLVLPGADKQLGTEDDLMLRDGVLVSATDDNSALTIKTTSRNFNR